MPKWCENDLKISGPQAQASALLTLIGINDNPPQFDFARVLAYPENFARMDAEWQLAVTNEQRLAYGKKYGVQHDGYNNGGYEWCVENWGTKWNVGEEVSFDGYRGLHFSTAWSAPQPIIAELGRLYPALTLTLRYYESGMSFQGLFKVREGTVICDECRQYNGTRGG